MALQTSRKKQSKKPLIITAAVIVALLCCYTAYAATSSSWPFATKSEPTTHGDTQRSSAGDQQKNDSKSNTSGSNQSATNKTPTQSTPPSNGRSTPADELSGVINYKQVSGGNLVLRNTINQSVSSGTCDLTLTDSAGHTITRSADIIANPSSSTCEGFSVPTSELHSGAWDITIHLTSGSQHGTIRSTVTI